MLISEIYDEISSENSEINLWKYGEKLIMKKRLMIFITIFCLFTGCGLKNGSNNVGNNHVSNDEQGSGSATLTAEAGNSEHTPIAESTQTPTATPTSTPTPTPTPTPDLHEYDFTLCFGGDISLDESAVTTAQLDSSENGIYDCISPELIEIMQNADIMCLNNEFTYSTQGKPLPGKMYTFRAAPERVDILVEMGVDLALLANNHVYDYGKEAMLDTFDTLRNAGIKYVGAGKNLDEAMTPVYYEIGGKTVAFVAASRAEKYKMTPQATETSPGILRCYDTELFLQMIREANANADFVIALVHWGTEYSYELEDVQLITGKEYLDAGADVIIGSHSHCLQGMEYYNGKPILYSLGNYWFNDKTLDTMLVELRFSGNDNDGNLEVSVIPAIQSDSKTRIVNDVTERERIFSLLEDISVNVEISEEGILSEKR